MLKFKWVKAAVEKRDTGETREYFYLVCLEKPDILDVKETKIVNDDYIHGVFIYDKIRSFSFVPHASEYNHNIIVSSVLKKKLDAHSISGLVFEPAELTF